MRTRYKIDDYQATYFVIDSFDQLFDATRPDFAPIYRRVTGAPEFEADSADDTRDQTASNTSG